MSNSTPIQLLSRTVERIQGAYAPSTIRAYCSDFAEYIGFCEAQGADVFPPNPFVVSPVNETRVKENFLLAA